MKLKKYKEFILENKISVDIPIPNDILEIANAYRKSGYDIFVVGGAIRDFLQGKTPHDYDLVTNALPNESKEILKGFNVSDEQGKNFGVLRVFTKDEPAGHEIASYRKDISKGRDTKGDEQKVEMGKHITIEDDVKRRDLTVNSLFYNIVTKEIIDLVGGVNDIKNNIIRAVGIPSERFAEDRLRIMRCFRFAARTGGEIDSTTSNAIKDDNRLIGISLEEDVSTERIWDEINKSWEQAKDFNRYLGFFTKYKMWDQIFPDSKINTNFVDSKDFVVVIANLFKNESTNRLEDKLVQLYKIESDIAKKVVFLLTLLSFNVDDVFDIYKKKTQCGVTDSTIIEWLKVNSIDEPMLTKFVDYKPSVSSKVLMDRGIKGRELGLEIKRLESENFKKIK
jgi:tRNA nucleotidyltransferase/poly(A) polymerase